MLHETLSKINFIINNNETNSFMFIHANVSIGTVCLLEHSIDIDTILCYNTSYLFYYNFINNK